MEMFQTQVMENLRVLVSEAVLVKITLVVQVKAEVLLLPKVAIKTRQHQIILVAIQQIKHQFQPPQPQQILLLRQLPRLQLITQKVLMQISSHQ